MSLRALLASTLVWLTAAVATGNDLYFPGDNWESVAPKDAGWDAERLAAAMDFAMSRNTSSIVILFRGRIMAERHQDLRSKNLARYQRMTHGLGGKKHIIEDVASVQKSVVSFLVGVAGEKRLVRLEDPVHRHLGTGWSKASPEQEKQITIRHLITMTSGLNDRLEFVARPGTIWKYNTTAYSQSLRAIAAASRKSPNELTSEWLSGPIGMKDSRWNKRVWANENVTANQYGFATTARDLARFGLLILAKGKWRDQLLLADQRYLKASLSTSQEMNPSYGYLWWLNGKESAVRGVRRARGFFIPTAPPDLVAALGALGRKCYVVPSLQIVVTRLGDTPEIDGKPRFDTEFWRRLMKAAPR